VTVSVNRVVYFFMVHPNCQNTCAGGSTILATMKDMLEKPSCGKLVVQVKEDEYTKVMRLKRPDQARLAVALMKDFHLMFGDPATSHLVKQFTDLWYVRCFNEQLFLSELTLTLLPRRRHSIYVLDHPIDSLQVYGIDGPHMVKELRESHCNIARFFNLLRPPLPSKFTAGEWGTWRTTYRCLSKTPRGREN
jgi:hypothetical protein